MDKEYVWPLIPNLITWFKAGEMTQYLVALPAVAGDPGLVSNVCTDNNN